MEFGYQPCWKSSHSLSKRLASLGIMGEQFMAHQYDSAMMYCPFAIPNQSENSKHNLI